MPFFPRSSIVQKQNEIKKDLKDIFNEAMQMHKSLPEQGSKRTAKLDSLIDKLNVLELRALQSQADARVKGKKARLKLTKQTLADIQLARERLLHYKALCDQLSNPDNYINARTEFALPNTRVAEALKNAAPSNLFTDKAFANRSADYVKHAKQYNDKRLLEWHQGLDKRISRYEKARKALAKDLQLLENVIKQYEDLKTPTRMQRLFRSHYEAKRQLKAVEVKNIYNRVRDKHKALNKEYKAIRKDVKRFNKSCAKLNISKAENKTQRRFTEVDLDKASKKTHISDDFVTRFNATSTSTAQDPQLRADLRAAEVNIIIRAENQEGIYQPLPLYVETRNYQALPQDVRQVQPVYQATDQYQQRPPQVQPVYQVPPPNPATSAQYPDDLAQRSKRAPLPEPIAPEVLRPVYHASPVSAAPPNLPPPPPQFNQLTQLARSETQIQAEYGPANRQLLQAAQQRMQNRQPLPNMQPAQTQPAPPSTPPQPTQTQAPVSPHAQQYAQHTAALAARVRGRDEQVAPTAPQQGAGAPLRRPPPPPPVQAIPEGNDPYGHTKVLSQQQRQRRAESLGEYVGGVERPEEQQQVDMGDVQKATEQQPEYVGAVQKAAERQPEYVGDMQTATERQQQYTGAQLGQPAPEQTSYGIPAWGTPAATPPGIRPAFVRPVVKPLPPTPLGNSKNNPGLPSSPPAPTTYQGVPGSPVNINNLIFPALPSNQPPPSPYAGVADSPLDIEDLSARQEEERPQERAFPKPKTLAEQEKGEAPKKTKKGVLDALGNKIAAAKRRNVDLDKEPDQPGPKPK